MTNKTDVECAGFKRARKHHGYETGKAWATDTTDLEQLQRVANRNRGPNYSRKSFWRDCIGLSGEDLELPRDGNWLFGFHAGVEDVWESIKDAI